MTSQRSIVFAEPVRTDITAPRFAYHADKWITPRGQPY
jgi:hypothetical protein